MAAAAAQVQKNSKSVRKPKLAPTKVHNLHHINYLNEKAREKELAENPPTGLSIDRPISVPSKILLTDDDSKLLKPGKGQTLRPDTRGGAESTIISSRPSTRNTTIKDGIIIRWENEIKPLLRRPRTSTDYKPQRKSSGKLNKARYGVAMTRSKAKGIVNAITQVAMDQKNGKMAAELNMDQALNPDNPYRGSKDMVIKQYHLWNSNDMSKVELPPIKLHNDDASTAVSSSCKFPPETDRALKQIKTRNQVTLSLPSLKSGHIFSKGCSYPPRRGVARSISEHSAVTPMEQIMHAMRGLL